MSLSPAVVLAVIFATTAAAQSAAPADNTLDTTGLPAYVKLLPSPEAEPWKPINEGERFRNFAFMSFGPSAALSSAVGAAMSQSINSPREWGQGWEAYGARVGSSYGGLLAGNTIEYAASMILREDNRYFRSNRTTFRGRLGYVLISPIMSNTGPGTRRLSVSSFLGGVGSATVPLTWAPASWQGWDSAGLNFLIFYGQQIGLNFAREFKPTVLRHFRARRKPAGGSTSSR